MTTVATPHAKPYAQPIGSPGAKRALALLIGQTCLLAGAIDAGYFIFFTGIGSPWLAWMNVISVGLYALAYFLVQRRHLRPAVFLIWFEAFPHAIAGTLMVGWAGGFHYLLLMFVPAIVISVPRRQGLLFVIAMLVFLFSLRILTYWVGPLTPIAPLHLDLLNWSNFTLFVLMFAWTADYYRRQMVKAEAQLQALATTDGLTRLANRRHFTGLTDALLAGARRSGSPCSIAVVDIDHFKAFNDTHGHDVGDQVLVAIAASLASTMRDSDVLARWGGEEFVIFMADTDAEGSQTLAERMRATVEATRAETSAGPLACTVSVGVAEIDSRLPLEAALTRADKALYQSKAAGRNRVTLAPPEAGTA